MLSSKIINLKYDKKRFKAGETHILYDKIHQFHKQNLYLVSTPGQMLSAIEAQNYFKTENNILVILFFLVRDGKEINEMFKLSEFFPFDKLITYQNQEKRNYVAFINYLNIITRNKYKHVFIGYNSPLYRRMIANIEYKDLYYLDTGMHTITTQEQIYNNNNILNKNPYKEFKERKRKEQLLSLVYQSKGYKFDTSMEDLNFFTVFNIDSYKNEKIIVHNYEYIKSLFSKDLNEYMSILLKIYKSNINGHIEILNKKQMMDIPLNKKSLISSSGISLDIYPDTIKTVKGYQNRLQSSIILQEKKFLENKLISDKELLKRLQNALIFKDGIVFDIVLNNMIAIFKNRMFEILNVESQSTIKRVIGLISTLNESLKLLSEAGYRFNEEIKIEGFYCFFDAVNLYLNKMINSKEKILLLNIVSLVYINYGKTISKERDRKVFKRYLYKNQTTFKHKFIQVLLDLPEEYYTNDSKILALVKDISNKYMKNNLYKKNSYYFYQTLFLVNKLEENSDKLCQYFIWKNFKITNIKNHLKGLSILLNNSSGSKSIRDSVWDIYSRATYSREYRIIAGLILVESYFNYGKNAKAIKLYFKIWKQFGCKNRDDALKYLDMMRLLKLDISHRKIFEELYNQYIFGAFLNTYNSDVLLDFLRYQEYMYKIEKHHDIEKKHTNRPINLKYDKKRFKAGETHILYDNIKSKEQNLYFVSTPGQMLSAIEAQNYFKTKNNVLVILFFVVRDGKNINQMFKLSELFPFDKLITYQNKSAKFYISFIPFLKLLKKIEVDYLFFGFNTILYRRMIANITYNKLYYLDDGVHTITTHEDTYNKANTNTRKEYIPFPKTINLQKMKFIYGRHGLKVDKHLDDLNFFTVYNLNQYLNEKIVKHNFSHIGSLLINNREINNTVYILGQPLVEIVGVEQEIYIQYLKNIFEYYTGYKILFTPHRLEIVHEEIKTYISEQENIELFVPDEPIEFYFLNNSIYPLEVASFITSALFNIRKLFPKTKTRAFEIDLTKLDIHHQQGISLIYKHFRNEDIEIISRKK